MQCRLAADMTAKDKELIALSDNKPAWFYAADLSHSQDPTRILIEILS